MTVSPLILRSESSTDFNCTDFLSLMIMNHALLLLILYPLGLKRKKCLATPLAILSPPHARQVVYFCALTQGSSKQYRCPAARKRKADECKVRDKCDQGAKKVRMGVTALNNKYDGVIDQASGGVTAVIYTLWQSLFRLHPGNGCLSIETR